MSTTRAFVFPGQGSQKPSMSKDIVETWPDLQSTVDEANALLGFSLSQLMFEGTADDLKPTEVTQPALFLASALMWEKIREASVPAACFAGHSLGEYTAYHAAGALSLADGLRAVRKRGELMAAADVDGKGTMASVLKLEDGQVEKLCEEASEAGVVVPANYNCPGQLVVSGERAGVEKVAELAKETGGRAMMLPVSGAFHSPLMAPAATELDSFLSQIPMNDAAKPVYTNVSAAPVESAAIRASLVKQLTSPVCWTQTIQSMLAAGITEFVEVGSGSVLTGLIKRIAPDANLVTVNSAESLQAFLESAS